MPQRIEQSPCLPAPKQSVCETGKSLGDTLVIPQIPWAPSGLRSVAFVFVLTVILLAATGRGQTVNFSDVSLTGPGTSPSPMGSYWNGSDGSGGFTSGGVFFNNSYDPVYGAWSGWAYSNVSYSNTSSELDPIGNPWYQYAAVTGTGVGSSAIYAVGYGDSGMLSYGGVLPTIAIPNGMQVQSAMFTNTTYAVASMLNGDQFATPFGPNDWFQLTITGLNSSGNSVGSINYYLASSGTITTTWQTVNLSSLSLATSLEFDLHSSDSSPFGINTPAYFAMGDLVLTPTAATSGTWSQEGGGTWGLGSNWSGGSVPAGGTLVFAGSTSGTAVVTLDGNRSAAALQFGNSSSADSFAISTGSGGVLTLGTSAGAAVAAISGTNTISAPIVLEGNLAVSASRGGSLDLAGSLSQAAGVSAGLTLSGNGQLILSGMDNYSGATVVNGGTLFVTTTTALPAGTSLAVAAGAAVVFDTTAAAEPVMPASAAAIAAVPEPATGVLLLACLGSAAIYCRLRK